jgi:hypothetical protein
VDIKINENGFGDICEGRMKLNECNKLSQIERENNKVIYHPVPPYHLFIDGKFAIEIKIRSWIPMA